MLPVSIPAVASLYTIRHDRKVLYHMMTIEYNHMTIVFQYNDYSLDYAEYIVLDYDDYSP